ncbi:MAG: protocatechuate 3,4-dioxygenase subunit alpha, partial [Pseudomonadota bacterium]
MAYRKETASQTAGPYVHIGLAPRAAGFESYDTDLGGEIAGPDAAGERIRVEGTVFDGSGSPVRDALIEVWQADADGSYAGASPGFTGWGRVAPDFETGRWAFDTIKPGRVTGRDGLAMAPHIALWIVARGINVGLHTRLYFDDEAEANATDPVLTLVEMVTRRRTLIAVREGD